MKNKETIDNKTITVSSGTSTDVPPGAFASGAQSEVLTLKPEWEVPKPKDLDEPRERKFIFCWDQVSNELKLVVNGEEYRNFKCKDSLDASIKYHEALDKMVSAFNSWRIFERN